jgi:anti-sigma factor RsiW
MNRLSCGSVRRELSAFHDGELPTAGQIAVETHLRGCQACAGELLAIGDVGDALRVASIGVVSRISEPVGLQTEILNHLRVEREESVSGQVSRAFEDMRLSFVAVGSTLATFVSILLMFGMLYFGPRSERSDSLAALIETMGAQSSSEVGMLMPRSAGTGMVPSSGVFSDEDALLALSAVVTRGGRIQNLEAVLSEQPSAGDREAVIRLLDQVSRARVEPARLGGSAVAVKTIMLFAHTTVRGKLPLTPKQSAAPRQSAVLG